MRYFDSFSNAIADARRMLLTYGNEVDAGRWQGVPTEGKPDLVTVEIVGWGFTAPMPTSKPDHCEMEQPLFMLRDEIQPNWLWADEHFAERVSRQPTNPGESYKNWPWWGGQFEATASSAGFSQPGHVTLFPKVDRSAMENFQFSHTYQERFWPKKAGERTEAQQRRGVKYRENHGIRYQYGDLDDLVNLLDRDPNTRQAYLPIFFPEDTGAVHGGRIPCTLGYHFMLRQGHLHCWYFIRSCDYVRHFRDDIYLAARLTLWVLEQLQERELRSDVPQLWVDVEPGDLTMVIPSLHYHKGDEHIVLAEA